MKHTDFGFCLIIPWKDFYMKNEKYTLGIDFGTLSARCVLTDTKGSVLGEAVSDYAHGVMDKELWCGVKLPPRFALQHPSDYLHSARSAVMGAVAKAGVSASDIVGLGIDFTGCTMLPVDENFEPLCLAEEFKEEPQAYVKLWKHYGAAEVSERINELAKAMNEKCLKYSGGYISPEWMIPKIAETLTKAPEVFDRTYRFMEAADWLVTILTGKESHSANFASFKAGWSAEHGYPTDEFLAAISPRLKGLVGTKLSTDIVGVAECAGYLNERGAELLGLRPGIAVATPCLDAHAAMPALGLGHDGDSMLIVGTSGIIMTNCTCNHEFHGLMGYAKDALFPGFYAYEAGQASVGDIFDWFVKGCVPESYEREARELGVGIHKLLRMKASRLKVGESGLVALDWHSGNRSPISDHALSSMMLGINMQTRPEEMYRAWLESVAYGLRAIVECFESHGVAVGRMVASGGIALKDELLMQIYADVLGKDIEVSSSKQAGALGSAAFAAVAAGIYPDITTAADAYAAEVARVYKPIPENVRVYETLYREYKSLGEYFSRENGVMKRLLKIREEA